MNDGSEGNLPREDENAPRRTERARAVAAKLRCDVAVTDRELDELFPRSLRALSAVYWTPIHVALRAAQLLVERPGARVLDIGSGVGKFCLVGALATRGEFVGVEQRQHLVECARDVATLLDARNASFVHGVFDALDPADYDAFYLFNPFEENLFPKERHFDATVPLGDARFGEDVRGARQFLRAAKEGARVVTFNGMGGPLPRCYELVERDQVGCTIELWVKDG